jgi:hypothetical protein
MDNKYTILNTGSEGDVKTDHLKIILNKFEYDLYHEEDDVPNPVVRVKRFSLPNKGERWKIFQDNKIIFVLEGAKLTKKEKNFLRTVDGVNFLITQGKKGIRSFNSLRIEIKKQLKPKKSKKANLDSE